MAKIVFAIHDQTTSRVLTPIIKQIESEIEVLLLTDLLPRSSSPSNNSPVNGALQDDLTRTKNALDYTNYELIISLDELKKEYRIPAAITERLIENIVPISPYDVERFVSDTEPDVFVAGRSNLAFIQEVIELSHSRDFKSVVIQHGTNRQALELPWSQNIPDLLEPELNPTYPRLEYLKRRLGYRYGTFTYGNPYLDRVYSFGEFFADRINHLRQGYPCFGKTDVLVGGNTEYDPEGYAQVETAIDSALFLSQWQYEGRGWTDAKQQKIVDILENFSRENNIPVTVRPHPKESKEKLERFFSGFEISFDNTLNRDIENHDMVITVDSTTIIKGILDGKVPAVLHPPWDPVTFEPFIHNHIIQLKEDNVMIGERCEKITVESQLSYLDKFCYLPSEDPMTSASKPSEYIATELDRLAHNLSQE